MIANQISYCELINLLNGGKTTDYSLLNFVFELDRMLGDLKPFKNMLISMVRTKFDYKVMHINNLMLHILPCTPNDRFFIVLNGVDGYLHTVLTVTLDTDCVEKLRNIRVAEK